MAALIEQNALTRRVRALSTVLLNGHLAASFAHELYNKMPGLELRLRMLADECRETEVVFPEMATTPEFQSMKRSLHRIVDTAVDLKETVALFQQLRGAKMTETCDVAEVVQRAMRLLNPLLRRNQIQTSIQVGGDSPVALGSGVRLQQALLNVMLNAIQHMEKSSGRRRELIVAVALAKEKNDMIQIHIADSGRGIHKRLWKRIFALGYTTREGGSGLGLFIARSLLASMGGRIVVERSLIPLGTTFLIEVPAAR